MFVVKEGRGFLYPLALSFIAEEITMTVTQNVKLEMEIESKLNMFLGAIRTTKIETPMHFPMEYFFAYLMSKYDCETKEDVPNLYVLAELNQHTTDPTLSMMTKFLFEGVSFAIASNIEFFVLWDRRKYFITHKIQHYNINVAEQAVAYMNVYNKGEFENPGDDKSVPLRSPQMELLVTDYIAETPEKKVKTPKRIVK